MLTYNNLPIEFDYDFWFTHIPYDYDYYKVHQISTNGLVLIEMQNPGFSTRYVVYQLKKQVEKRWFRSDYHYYYAFELSEFDTLLEAEKLIIRKERLFNEFYEKVTND